MSRDLYMVASDKNKLNENDKKLLLLCKNRPYSVSDIARKLNISPASVSMKVSKLENLGKINVQNRGLGKKTLIRTKKGIKHNIYLLKILRYLKKHGGMISLKEYDSILFSNSNFLTDPNISDKNYVSYWALNSEFVERKVVLTEQGNKLLHEIDKKLRRKIKGRK